jgi:hypothetical protein
VRRSYAAIKLSKLERRQ